MQNWMNRRQPIEPFSSEPQPEPITSHGRRLSGNYVLLYDYLANRYANRIVLTFQQIEDLLGFNLPDLARLHQEWWTSPEASPAPTSYANAWILANRTARPNLFARTVLFERLLT